MRWCLLRIPLFRFAVPFGLLLAVCLTTSAQSTASIEGQVVDQFGAVIPRVKVSARDPAIGVEREANTDSSGRYQLPALPLGDYIVDASATGFKKQVVERLRIEVGRRITQNFQLETGDISEQVTVIASGETIDRATVSVGHVIDRRMVHEVPLNGRYFLDLGLLVPGSVTPPQGAFSASPMRGLGSLAINTGGNREETVNYLINGITLNNLTFSSISFQPSINTIQEFKVDNSTFSAEYGAKFRRDRQHCHALRRQRISWRSV